MRSERDWLVLMVMVVLLLAGIACCTSADAHIFTQSECRKAAGTVLAVAEAKGDGAPQSRLISDVMGILVAHKGQAGSFIKDDDDLDTLNHAMAFVFSHDITPGQAYDQFFFPCSRAYTDKGGS